MDWSEYLTLAKELAECDQESYKRSAISRAYYSAFCTTRGWLEEHQDFRRHKESGGSHERVWTAMKESSVKKLGKGSQRLCKHIWNVGRQLKRRRQFADYDDVINDIDKEVEQSLKEAEKILANIEELRRRVAG